MGRGFECRRGFFHDVILYPNFVRKIKIVFDHPNHRGDASFKLLNLHQGNKLVAVCLWTFWTSALEAQWNEITFRAVFTKGLHDHLRDELPAREEPNDLTAFVS